MFGVPKRYLAIGIVFVLLGVAAFLGWNRQGVTAYETLTLTPETLVSTVDVSGVVESERKVTLKASVATQILGRSVPENKRVPRGTRLLQVNNSTYRIQLDQARTQRNTAIEQARVERNLAQTSLAEARVQAQNNLVNLRNQLQKAEESLFFLRQEKQRSERLYREKVISAQAYQQAQQQLDQALLDLTNAQSRLSQATESRPEVVQAQQRLTQALTALNTAQQQGVANVALPRENLRQSEVFAPFDGSITRWLVNRGDYAAPAAPLADFQDLQDLRLVLSLNELDFPRVKVGATVNITFDAYPDTPYQGSVSSMSQASIEGAENVQVYPIRVWFQNPELKIKPGMSGDAQITATRKENVLSVPLSAVERKDDNFYVKILDEQGEPQDRKVTLGLSTLDKIEITRGVKAGEKVVLGEATSETTTENSTDETAGGG